MLGFHLGLYSDRVARSLLDYIDILILITSAICHDLDHPGYNNAYQVFCYLYPAPRKLCLWEGILFSSCPSEHPTVFLLITSAICHDLDHSGYNNAYQVFCYFTLKFLNIQTIKNVCCNL